MHYKNKIQGALFAASLLAIPHVQAADNGTINFSGRIQAESCSVAVDNAAVSLGTMSHTAFAASGPAPTSMHFNLTVGACPNVKVVFAAAGNSTIEGTGRLTTNLPAMHLEFLDAAGTVLDLNAHNAQAARPLLAESVSAYGVRYFAQRALTAQDVGSITAALQYTLHYE